MIVKTPKKFKPSGSMDLIGELVLDLIDYVVCVVDDDYTLQDDESVYTDDIPVSSDSITVTARRFTQVLLGTHVFAAILVVRDTLATNINTISEQEKSILGLLSAAQQLLVQNGDIELDNPDVGIVLDLCVRLDDVPFDDADKARVLSNGPYVVQAN